MTCVTENEMFLFELPVLAGMKGKSGAMFLNKMSDMSNVTRQHKL